MCCHEGHHTPGHQSFVVVVVLGFFKIDLYSFWLHREACGILVPRPGIKPMSPEVEAWSPNHWTARKVLGHHC